MRCAGTQSFAFPVQVTRTQMPWPPFNPIANPVKERQLFDLSSPSIYSRFKAGHPTPSQFWTWSVPRTGHCAFRAALAGHFG